MRRRRRGRRRRKKKKKAKSSTTTDTLKKKKAKSSTTTDTTAEAHIGARQLALEFGKCAAQHLFHLLAIRIGAAREEGHARDVAHRFAATFSKVSALVYFIYKVTIWSTFKYYVPLMRVQSTCSSNNCSRCSPRAMPAAERLDSNLSLRGSRPWIARTSAR